MPHSDTGLGLELFLNVPEGILKISQPVAFVT
jgi:hypothetical protein